ncbi:MAG: hypothetical protein JNK21_16270 [Rhodospirillaceae bacterium]|nr:hypothetical protein [Rhodospirillaceae bacterium]
MRLTSAFTVLMLVSAPAAAIEGAGNPWETADNAICVSLELQDFSAVLGEVVGINAGRVPAAGDRPGYCHVEARLGSGAVVDAKLPLTGWSGQKFVVECVGACNAAQHRNLNDALTQKSVVAFHAASEKQTPPGVAAFLDQVVQIYYGRAP